VDFVTEDNLNPGTIWDSIFPKLVLVGKWTTPEFKPNYINVMN
jgi:hypothetical protein